jgi:hypothetical protein
MSHATCARCGASQPLLRVYLGMQSPRPNLIAISCTECGEVSSQLRTLGDYLLFAVVYGLLAALFVVLGMFVGPDVEVVWVAIVAGLVPFFFLPAWWASLVRERLAGEAPADDLTVAQKLLFLLVAATVIGAMVGGGVFAYLRWLS